MINYGNKKQWGKLDPELAQKKGGPPTKPIETKSKARPSVIRSNCYTIYNDKSTLHLRAR